MMPVRILIADDTAATRKMLHRLLFREGYDVCGEAQTGVEAVTKAIDLKPDVVILDLAMPDGDGLTAADHISRIFPELPMVLYTLHALPQLEMEAKKHGIRCVVSKTEISEIFSFLGRLRDGHLRGTGRVVDARLKVEAIAQKAEKTVVDSQRPRATLEDLKKAS